MKGMPGPANYQQKRLFDDIPSKQFDSLGVDGERPPFGTQAKVKLIIIYYCYENSHCSE
jgi:hypothetical protein